jgi:CHAT domain-containing protein/tetratricopeptide (TPR) repeat protein
VFAHVELLQSGVDASITVKDPLGETVAQVDDADAENSAEFLSWITNENGRYRISVNAKAVIASGSFEVRLDPPRARGPEDDAWILNERLLAGSYEMYRAEQVPPAEWRVRIERVRAEARRLGDLRTEMRALKELGCRLRDMKEAVEFALEAAAYAETTGDRSFEDALTCATGPLRGLGYLDEAIEIQRLLLDRRHAAGDLFLEIEALYNLGAYLLARGDTAEAAERLHESHELAIAQGDRFAAAAALGALARLHVETGAYQDALDGFTQALAMHRELGARAFVNPIQSNMAEVYYELGDLPAAAITAGEVIESAPQLKHWGPLLSALRTRGLVRMEQGATEDGLADLTRSVALARRSGAGYLTVALNRLGHAKFRAGAVAEARSRHLEALRISEEGNRWGDQAEALFGLCAVGERVGQLDQAREYCTEGLEIVDRLGLERGRLAGLYRLARVARRQGSLEEAHEALEQALKLIDARRYRLRRIDLRETYLGTLREIEDEYVDLLVELSEREPDGRWARDAFEASEQRRARNLREMLFSSGHEVTEGVDRALVGQDRLLRDRLRQAMVRQVGLGAGSSLVDPRTVAREVADLTAALEDVGNRIRASSPRYAALTQPQATTLEDIQREVVDESSILLFYALGERRSFLWVVSPSGLKRYSLPARNVVEGLAARFHRAIARQVDPSPALASLSRMLLRPAASELHDKRLLVIGDGALLYLPFAALPDPRGRGSLIRRNEVVHLPSAASVVALRATPRKEPTRTVAVLADPVFSPDDGRVPLARRARDVTATASTLRGRLARALVDVGQRELWRLPATRHEAEAIRGLVAPDESRFALDFEASRTTALDPDMASYRFLHFATHGIINSARPELSGLVLSLVDAQGRPQDGLLTSLDTFDLKLSADVVVLSGCRTALGREVRGEGIIGLTRGLMYAGARGVLASLWPVHDRATASLMSAFYEGMLGPRRLPPPAALREAQLKLMKTPRWSSPYYWAAFQLQGDWATKPAASAPDPR